MAGLGLGQALATDNNGGPWESGTIYVLDKTKRPQAVDLAMSSWNRQGVGIQFIATQNPAKADLVISEDRKRVRAKCSDCGGFASVGRQQRQAFIVLDQGVRSDPTVSDVQLLVHEFGHVLGLKHVKHTCSIMNSDIHDPLCSRLDHKNQDRYRCGPLPVDQQQLIKLYGKTNRSLDGYCEFGDKGL